MTKIFNQKLENILLWGIKIGIFLILLTPIVLTPATVYPSVFPKVIYFRILVEILLFFYILLLFCNSKYLPRISPIFISLLFFIIILGLSSCWRSINPQRSFWGTVERMEGFSTWLHIFIFFLILVSVLRERKDWLNFFRFSVLFSIPIGIAGIIQRMGIFNFYTQFDPANPRISATFGNPVFYGSYLVLIIFLAVLLGIFEEKKKFKILFFAIFVFNVVLLLLTGTRGAWIGTISGIFLFLIWFLFSAKVSEGKRKAFLFSVFLLFLFFLLFLLFSRLGLVPKTSFLERYELLFSNLIEFEDPRANVWGLGIEVWKKNPIFGYGLESFNFLYDKNYKASFIKNIPEDMFFDRAHNKIIDVLVETGILGLLAYFAIFFAAIFLILKHREKFNDSLFLLLISLLFAYFVQNIFAFDMITSYIIFFLVLGFIDVNFRKENQFKKTPNFSLKFPNQKLLFGSKIVTSFLLPLFLIGAMFLVNIRPLIASMRMAKGREFLDKGEVEKAIEYIEKSFIRSDFTYFEAHFYSAANLFNAQSYPPNIHQRDKFSPGFQKLVKPLEEHLDKKAEIKHMLSYLLLAQIYRDLYFIERDLKYLEDEERILGKAMQLNSQFPKIYRLAGEMRFLQHRKEEGMVFFSKAYELDGDYPTFLEAIARALLTAGEKEKGADMLRKAMKLGDFYTEKKFDLGLIWRLADTYEELGKSEKMIELYEETILLYPQELRPAHPQLYASLATVYAKIGNEEKARQTIQEMLKFYPQLGSKAQEFLSTLEEE